jgi:hypothetical protein
MAQLLIAGPIIHAVVGTRMVEVARIEPERARRALEIAGHSAAVARIVAYGGLDSTQARRLGQQIGLLAQEVTPTL